MHRIGLLGGMSWHSTAHYYRGVNEAVAAARGGHASAPMLIDSADFAEIRALQVADDWEAAGEALAASARRLESAGAEVLAVATNLMHKVAPAVEAAVEVPLLHIADAVAAEARADGAATLGVLGTARTMEDDFYRARLSAQGLDVIVPEPGTCRELDRWIFDELTQGTFSAPARAAFARAMTGLRERGADAVVLGCTEIGILVPPAEAPVPVLDSLDAHVAALGRFCLQGELPPAPSAAATSPAAAVAAHAG